VRPVALVCSSGGHLAHLLVLEPWWRREENRFWVSFNTPDAMEALEGERHYWCFHPTNRNVWNLVRNIVLAVRVVIGERPRLIVSSGAAVAVPFFYIGKLFGAKTIFVEVVDRVDNPTLTGRLVKPVTDRYAVQWPEQLAAYPRSTLIGRLM
jgi:UDP-N-acetylglucosamine:LPS N-acetylglucosamine transferase